MSSAAVAGLDLYVHSLFMSSSKEVFETPPRELDCGDCFDVDTEYKMSCHSLLICMSVET